MKWQNVTYMMYHINSNTHPFNGTAKNIAYRILRPIQGQKSAVCVCSQSNLDWSTFQSKKTNYMPNIPYAILLSSAQLTPILKKNSDCNFQNTEKNYLNFATRRKNHPSRTRFHHTYNQLYQANKIHIPTLYKLKLKDIRSKTTKKLNKIYESYPKKIR